MTRKHYNDGFEGPPLEAGITWWPGEGQSIEAGTGETEGLDAQRESGGALQAQAPEHLLSPSIPTTIGERQAIAETVEYCANIQDSNAVDGGRREGCRLCGSTDCNCPPVPRAVFRSAGGSCMSINLPGHVALSPPTVSGAVDAEREAIARIEHAFDTIPCYASLIADDVRLLIAALRQTLPIHGEMREALEQAATWFEEYATEHYAKALTAPDSREQHGREVKGKTNRDRAAFLRNALQGDGL